MSRPLAIGLVAPVARSVPPEGSGSVELMTSLLAEGLVARGHQVTLFATRNSRTTAHLAGRFERGYAEGLPYWPWEFCELLHVAEAVERSRGFDVLHVQSEYYPISLAFTTLAPVPLLHTVHHAPSAVEVELWAQYPRAPFVAISQTQAALLAGLHVAAVVHHGVEIERMAYRDVPDDYLAFLGRFTPGKGVLEAIEVARRTGHRLKLAAPVNDYYRDVIAPHVDGTTIEYVGELGHDDKVRFVGGARALVYPVQAAEPFGLVLAEAMACGTPVAALRRGAVEEIVDDGVTGWAFDSLRALEEGLPRVLALDRRAVRARAVERHGTDRMVREYEGVYRTLAAGQGSGVA